MFPDIFNQFVIAKLPLYSESFLCHVTIGNIKMLDEGMERKNRGRNRQRRSTSVERFVISNCDN